MSALTDLQTAVTNLGTSISAEIDADTAAIKAAQGANVGNFSYADNLHRAIEVMYGEMAQIFSRGADVEAVVSSLNDLKAKMDAETAALTPPAPPATS